NLISCSQFAAVGAASDKVARQGGRKAARAPFGAPARASPGSLGFERARIGFTAAARARVFLRAVFFADVFFADAFRVLFFAALFFAVVRLRPPLASAATLAFTLRLLCQTFFDCAISSRSRPLTTDSGFSSRMSLSRAERS